MYILRIYIFMLHVNKYQLILNAGGKSSGSSFTKIYLTRLQVCNLLIKRFKFLAHMLIFCVLKSCIALLLNKQGMDISCVSRNGSRTPV
jgi:hypothetical protein